jgi:hypothetical protein
MTDGKSRMGDIGALGVVGAAGVAGAGAVMLPSIGPLKVVKQAQNQLAYTNCVYVSATLIDPFPMADNTFVMINGRVFVVRPHDAMQAGAIGLNFMQRTTLGLENGDLVTVAIWTPPLDPTFNLCGARIEFETHEAGLARLSFKEDDMLPLLKSAFAGQILSVGQSFFGQMGNLAIKYQVKSLDAPTRDDQDSKSTPQPPQPRPPTDPSASSMRSRLISIVVDVCGRKGTYHAICESGDADGGDQDQACRQAGQ